MTNWVTLPAPAVTGYGGGCSEIQALDENTVLMAAIAPAAGPQGVTPAFIKTTDGGQTWSGGAVPELGYSSNGRAAQLHFATDKIGYMAWDSGYTRIAVTTNGGASWTTTNVPTGEPQYVWALDATTALASGRIGTASAIWRTTDLGTTWIPVWMGASVFTAGRLMMFDENVGIAQAGLMVRTTDGGRTWAAVTAGFTWNGPWARVSATEAYVVRTLATLSVLFHTTDGGQTFTQVGTGTLPCTVASLAFLDPMHGLVGCAPEQTARNLHTSDGGQTWTSEAWPAGWAVGSSGIRSGVTCMAWPSATAAYAQNDGGPGNDLRAIKRTGDPEPIDGAVDASVDAAIDAAERDSGTDATNPETGDGGGGCCDTSGGAPGATLLAAALALVLARRRR